MTLRQTVLNSGIFLKKDNLSLYMLHPGSPFKLSRQTFSGIKVSVLASGLTKVLHSYSTAKPEYSLKHYLKGIEDNLVNVLEDHHFPIQLAEKEIAKIIKNKEFKQQLDDTGAFDKSSKAFHKYTNLYFPIYEIFCGHLGDKLGSKPQDTIYSYMSHFLVGCGIEKPSVKQAYERIKRAIARFEKSNPAFKLSRPYSSL